MKKNKLILVLLLSVLIFSYTPQQSVNAQEAFSQTCPPNAKVNSLLNQITQASVEKWLRNFSGADPVMINGVQRTILTRHSSMLFTGNTTALAYDYLQQELEAMGYVNGVHITDHSFSGTKTQADDSLFGNFPDWPEVIDVLPNGPESKSTWKNKIVTLPGSGPNKDEIVIISAHLDSRAQTDHTIAPGAEDNGSGVAALMEAARLFKNTKFDRTVKIIFFTGEEQGLYGSKAYVLDHPDEMSKIVAVFNLDMFGYDNDQDMCMELHVGTMAASQVPGKCFTDVNENYNLGLKLEYIDFKDMGSSDHAPFWNKGIGAIELLENFYSDSQVSICNKVEDRNPAYHSKDDTIDKMWMPATIAGVKAGVGAAASLAGPEVVCLPAPTVTGKAKTNSIELFWKPIVDAIAYKVFRGTKTCGGEFSEIAEVMNTSYEDFNIDYDRNYFYKVQAIGEGGFCVSELSNCVVAKVKQPGPTPTPTPEPDFDYFINLPVITVGK